MAAKTERTFIAVKPDGVQRGLIGEIVKRFEQKGFRLVAMKFLQASEDLLKQHYIDLKDRPFYPGLVKYMSSGPVAAMVWEGLNVVKTGRVMLGETNPADSKPGTIRGDFCIEVGSSERADETQSAVTASGGGCCCLGTPSFNSSGRHLYRYTSTDFARTFLNDQNISDAVE
uniref:nucleoside-diphosphate kinase n=1 Tax=Cyprinus carpio carpio TaxID=630221 RepID=A0A8C1AJI7_CYPCA